MDFKSITDDEVSLVEAGGILSQEEASNSKTSVAPCSAVVSASTSRTPLARACAVVALGPAPVPAVSSTDSPVRSRSVVTLRTPSIYRLEVVHIAASNVAAAAGLVSDEVAILDSGATQHLWPFYQAFINYCRVHNQHITLANNSKVSITGKCTIAVEMGGKKVVIRDVWHVPDLRLPLFSLRVHRRVPGCGYHSDNDDMCCFPPPSRWTWTTRWTLTSRATQLDARALSYLTTSSR